MADRANPLRHWWRCHTNGIFSSVVEVPYGDDRFAAGASPGGAPYQMAEVVGLAFARAYADRESGCPQPCACEPWPDEHD